MQPHTGRNQQLPGWHILPLPTDMQLSATQRVQRRPHPAVFFLAAFKWHDPDAAGWHQRPGHDPHRLPGGKNFALQAASGTLTDKLKYGEILISSAGLGGQSKAISG